MPGRVRSVSSYRRELLNTGWEMCSTQPGAFEHPAALNDNPDWLTIGKPTTAADALRSLGKWSLDDPPRRFDAEDWWFRVRFATPELNSGEKLVLGFDGLATLADAWLNGEHILASDNMFVAHERELQFSASQCELVIRCSSLDASLKKKRPRPRWRAPMIENQQLRWFRATLLGRTPGWSPSAAAVGPWRDVWIERRATIEINRLDLRTRLDGDRGVVDIAIDLHTLDQSLDSCVLTLQHEAATYHTTLNETAPGKLAGCLSLKQPKLWWPHTHGEPALYPASLQITCGSGIATIDIGHIAFRDIRAHTADDDFSLFVNGANVFCRGACWTPLDPVTLRADATTVRDAIGQTVNAGMNMLRVSGTMVYEDETFLDECDRRGILLWQDFMFANMDYPAGDSVFDASVRREVEQQLARLQSRACLAVLCGNSEGAQQAAMWGAGRELWQPALFHETLPALCAQSNDTAYWPSSAFGGSFPHQPDSGTTSYYGVGAYQRPLEDARRSDVRFATECLAFANVPESGTIATMPGGYGLRVHHPAWKAATPRDLGAGWDFEDVRDHYVRTIFGIDPVALRYADHDRYLELSRVASGEVMALTFAEWRRRASRCNGGLIWFLRDFVAGAGWGIIDSLGQPKAAYYIARRALLPRAVFISDEGVNGPRIHVVNEDADTLEAEVTITAFKRSINVASATQNVMIAGRSAVAISALDGFDGFRDLCWAYRFGPPTADLLVASLSTASHGLIGEHFYFPLGRSAGFDTDSGLSAIARSITADEALLTVSARQAAQAIQIEADGFISSDQYFDLAPGGQKTVTLRRRAGTKKHDLHGTIHALNSRETARITVE